ncbi:MAG: hypothetical protein IJ324_04495 [Lachnospiraceae bacterium]|nr:hypothetical protein [Lachnospiraceae bacterium]
MKKNSVLSAILTVVMVIECVLIIITFGVFWSEFSYDYSWYADEDDMVYAIEQERYGQLVKNYYYNELGGEKANNDMRECYGVAKYFEAALWHNAYETVGDSRRSGIYAEKMADAYEEMGVYHFLDTAILEKLNME